MLFIVQNASVLLIHYMKAIFVITVVICATIVLMREYELVERPSAKEPSAD